MYFFPRAVASSCVLTPSIWGPQSERGFHIWRDYFHLALHWVKEQILVTYGQIFRKTGRLNREQEWLRAQWFPGLENLLKG